MMTGVDPFAQAQASGLSRLGSANAESFEPF
jgi:hypothetical protein